MTGRLLAAFLAALPFTSARGQDGIVVYRLGADTVAIERYSRTASRFAGEMVTRTGAAVVRTSYELTLANGRLTAATVKRMQPDGSPLRNAPAEVRFTFRGDSVLRTQMWADSAPTRAWAARNAFVTLPVYIYAPYGMLDAIAASGGRRDSLPSLGIAGNNIGMIGLERMSGDTSRLRGAPYPMLLRYDQSGRLLSVDGRFTTNKIIGTATSGTVDLAAIAGTMKPTGVLSPRQTAYAAFATAPITINYGSPAVRGRTVWGGTLVPFDSIWRAGANEATHLATSKAIQFGDITVAPGLYTLWIQHTRTGTWLILNRQIGQWGTVYNAADDIGRVSIELARTPSHVEDFTITVRSLGGGRGAFDFAWGDQSATATFAVRQ
jgi:hypothetical protein